MSKSDLLQPRHCSTHTVSRDPFYLCFREARSAINPSLKRLVRETSTTINPG